jgi:NUBPL iron-transfer P-loop NTPase
MSYFACESCHEKHRLYGNEAVDFCKINNLPYLGALPFLKKTADASDKGYPAVFSDEVIRDSFSEVSNQVLAKIGIDLNPDLKTG